MIIVSVSSSVLILIILLLAIVVFFLIGKLLDLEAERIIDQLYIKDKNGVNEEMKSVQFLSGHDRAIILFHGYARSPLTFANIANQLAQKKFDLFVPRLPYHGERLNRLTKINNADVADAIESQIQSVAKKYKQTTVLGYSYSGAILLSLMEQQRIPDSVNVILYAPAIYLRVNTFSKRLMIFLYDLWRHYCNYPLFGCRFPNYENGDKCAIKELTSEKTYRYQIMPFLKQMNKQDFHVRKALHKIKHPFQLVVAKDDNRVNAPALQHTLKNNPLCHFHLFPSGRHEMHRGCYKQKFIDLIVKIANEK